MRVVRAITLPSLAGLSPPLASATRIPIRDGNLAVRRTHLAPAIPPAVSVPLSLTPQAAATGGPTPLRLRAFAGHSAGAAAPRSRCSTTRLTVAFTETAISSGKPHSRAYATATSSPPRLVRQKTMTALAIQPQAHLQLLQAVLRVHELEVGALIDRCAAPWMAVSS